MDNFRSDKPVLPNAAWSNLRAWAMDIGANARIGDFELLRQIGAGGQAIVYLARPWQADPERRRRGRLALLARLSCGAITTELAQRAQLAALKLARPEHIAALHDEHGWLARPVAQHEYLVQLHSRRFAGGPRRDLGFASMCANGSPPTLPFLALAYEPGQTLDTIIAQRRGRPLPISVGLEIARQTAIVLDHLHCRLGLVHHDIKPANLLFHAGRTVLLDLGAAESPAMPRRRWLYGTQGYLPPERLLGAPASPLVDIYSLGMLLQTMLAGQKAIVPALRTLIDGATDGNPDRRAAAIPTMASMIEQLAALSGGTTQRW